MSSKAATERGLSRRALFGAGLGRLAGERLERLEGLTGEDTSPSPAADPRAEAERLKRDLRNAWGAGDPRPFLQRLEPVAERLVTAAGVQGHQRALDVGAGDGNVASVLARRGVATDACDLTPEMVDRGRARTGSEGLAVGWHEADVEALPFADGEFDAVLSSFGAIWAPRADRAVAGITRVCRPGGTIALAAPVPFGFIGRAIALGREAAGWPAKAQRPERWGRYETAYLHLFGLEDLQVLDETLTLEFEDADELWRIVSIPAGPLGRARLARPDRADVLRGEVLDLAAEHGEEKSGSISVPSPYALLIGRRPLDPPNCPDLEEACPDRGTCSERRRRSRPSNIARAARA